MPSINFIERGSGEPVILIHGFPFNQQIWSDFAEQLAGTFRVFTVDLPGFGKSPMLEPGFSLDDVAKSLLQWMHEQALSQAVIIGHSLGGYVALSMAHKKPALFSKLILFHSTAYADSEEKKENRNKVLDFIDKNGVVTFTSNFIAPLFANQQHSAIAEVKEIAKLSDADVVKGYTRAMRDRHDQTGVLVAFPRPILIITGDKDSGIPVESVKNQSSLSAQVSIKILAEVGHMGMLERSVETLNIISNFILQSNQP